MKDESLVKCVVWDLDNTMWEGVLLEGGAKKLRDGIENAVRFFDERGILQSISSRNDHQNAFDTLKSLGLSDFFLYPEINWGPKSESIKRISENLNLGLDSFVFIDDQQYEREEVAFALPSVRCIDPDDLTNLLNNQQVASLAVTTESKNRRFLYLQESNRKKHEESFGGNDLEFRKSLGLVFTIFEPTEEDLARASELTVRTHQLNTTGVVYTEDELKKLAASDDYLVLLAKLTDRFGDYGIVGVAVVERTQLAMKLNLLLMSCRVMSRGVGTIFLIHLMTLAKQNNLRFFARFEKTERNRMMYITYKMNGFKVAERDGASELLEHDLDEIQPIPDFIQLNA